MAAATHHVFVYYMLIQSMFFCFPAISLFFRPVGLVGGGLDEVEIRLNSAQLS